MFFVFKLHYIYSLFKFILFETKQNVKVLVYTLVSSNIRLYQFTPWPL